MLPRCLVLCTLLLAPWLPGVAQFSPNVLHVGRDIVLPREQRFHNASCFLCSADVQGHTTGSVRVFAGNVFLSGAVAGDVLVFGGNVTLTGSATISGRLIIIGGHLRQDPAAISLRHTVLSPIIFLPMVLVIAAIIEALIVLTRRMVRGPVAFPPLPRL